MDTPSSSCSVFPLFHLLLLPLSVNLYPPSSSSSLSLLTFPYIPLTIFASSPKPPLPPPDPRRPPDRLGRSSPSVTRYRRFRSHPLRQVRTRSLDPDFPPFPHHIILLLLIRPFASPDLGPFLYSHRFHHPLILHHSPLFPINYWHFHLSSCTAITILQ